MMIPYGNIRTLIRFPSVERSDTDGYIEIIP